MSIKNKLEQHFHPTLLEVRDDSHKHAGHNEEAKAGGTHIFVKMVSAQFNNVPLLKRHRMVNDLLKEEFENTNLHALQLKLFSPEEV